MNEEFSRHMDCRNYAALDVVKGICHLNKQMVEADNTPCLKFSRMPRCRVCKNYFPGPEKFLGTCLASKNETMTYPDLIGLTCEWFDWIKEHE